MRLATTHSKKIPGAEKYCSEIFSAMIEVKIPDETGRDATPVQGWLRELYAQAKSSVDEQIKTVPPPHERRPRPQRLRHLQPACQRPVVPPRKWPQLRQDRQLEAHRLPVSVRASTSTGGVPSM